MRKAITTKISVFMQNGSAVPEKSRAEIMISDKNGITRKSFSKEEAANCHRVLNGMDFAFFVGMKDHDQLELRVINISISDENGKRNEGMNATLALSPGERGEIRVELDSWIKRDLLNRLKSVKLIEGEMQ